MASILIPALIHQQKPDIFCQPANMLTWQNVLFANCTDDESLCYSIAFKSITVYRYYVHTYLNNFMTCKRCNNTLGAFVWTFAKYRNWYILFFDSVSGQNIFHPLFYKANVVLMYQKTNMKIMKTDYQWFIDVKNMSFIGLLSRNIKLW